MDAWFALPAGPRITKSAPAVTGVIASTSRHASHPSRQWPGFGKGRPAGPGARPPGPPAPRGDPGIQPTGPAVTCGVTGAVASEA